MIIPVRCFSCGKVRRCSCPSTYMRLTCAKVVGDLWERYLKLIDEGVNDGYGFTSCNVSLVAHLGLEDSLVQAKADA